MQQPNRPCESESSRGGGSPTIAATSPNDKVLPQGRSYLSGKRVSLDPNDQEGNAKKQRTSADSASISAAESMILAARGPQLAFPMSNASMFAGAHNHPFSGASDARRFMAERRFSLTGFYPHQQAARMGMMGNGQFFGGTSSSVFGGGLSQDFMGMPPPPEAAAALRRRADFLESLAFAPSSGAYGFPSGVNGSVTPAMATSLNPMPSLRRSSLPLPAPERPSPALMPRQNSQSSSAREVVKSENTHQQLQRPSVTACGEEEHAHFNDRVCISLAIDQDPNWLSELQCFVRKNLLEVCWANREDVAVRNASKKVSLEQVGIRCRFCAHKPPGSRAQRSSAFPSSIPQLYQSFTMMLRDHFDNCSCIPEGIQKQYLTLKSSTCQGATEAKKYWSYSAAKLGMVDSDGGMLMSDATREAAGVIPAFGAVNGEQAVPLGPDGNPVILVKHTDRDIASGFLFTLISHFRRIELLPSERKGNRKSLRCGLPGFGCVYCSDAGRFGMSRVFPARRRTLPVRVADLYDHICRCNLCPPEAKLVLQRLRDEKQEPAHEKQFLDLVWERLGHTQANPC